MSYLPLLQEGTTVEFPALGSSHNHPCSVRLMSSRVWNSFRKNRFSYFIQPINFFSKNRYIMLTFKSRVLSWWMYWQWCGKGLFKVVDSTAPSALWYLLNRMFTADYGSESALLFSFKEDPVVWSSDCFHSR